MVRFRYLIGCILAALLLASCSTTEVEGWRIRYHADVASLRTAASDAIARDLIEIGTSPNIARFMASAEAARTIGYADPKTRTIHVLRPRGDEDRYRLCVLGHEVLHATDGAFHGARPSTGCTE